MNIDDMDLSENDLKEIYSLFCASTDDELGQVYNKESFQYFLNENISEIYDLSEEKREYARDAWRSVIYFLYKQGFNLELNNKIISMDFIRKEFINTNKPFKIQ